MGIAFVAISPDTVAELRRFLTLTGVELRLLADPGLELIDAWGVGSDKTLALGPGRRVIRRLAVPTTVLVDAQGRVAWIDQSGDFRIRSDPERVLSAIVGALERAP